MSQPAAGWSAHADERRSLARILRDHAARDPDGAALIEPGRRFGWRDYDRLSDAIAARLLAAGLRAGDHVGLLVPDGILLHGALIGAEKAGCVALGLGARAGLREAAHLLAKGRAVALVSLASHRGEDAAAAYRWLSEQAPALRAHIVLPDAPEALLDEAPAAPPPLTLAPDALFLLNSTSGTTGMPKCVMHDQRRWYAFHDMAAAAGALSGADVFMSCPPAPFGFGIWTSHVTPLLLGAPVVVFPRFDADSALALIEEHRVTVMAAVTTQMTMMLSAPRFADAALSSLRVVFAGGEAIPAERSRAFEARTGAKVLNAYGSNETGALSCTTVRDPQDKRLNSAGRPLDTMHVRLFDEGGRDVTAQRRGRPAGKGPLLSRGYFDDDAANARLFTADGCMLMDDIVEIDDEGYVHVVGRTGDFVLRGGKNISCAAVEEMACTHPAVHLAAAVPAPDAVFGERVALFVTLQAGADSLTLDELVAHFRARRASPEIFPEWLAVRDDLPRSTGDKIAKHQLREEVGALIARRADAISMRKAS